MGGGTTTPLPWSLVIGHIRQISIKFIAKPLYFCDYILYNLFVTKKIKGSSDKPPILLVAQLGVVTTTTVIIIS